jgi:Zn-dependent protease with chaperone function
MYHFGLLLVALAMLVLPLVYLGLIAGLGYFVYWHATENVTIFEGRGNGKWKLFIYAAPLLVGAVLLVFMVKPLFARRPRAAAPLSLRRHDQPVLFAYVERLCDLVGAPRPARIDVDCRVNASASFREGVFGLLGGRLVLTIGLPLAAGLTLRQLTGVLAHEFGHFAQGTGMRLTYLIRSVNAWFYRVVNERDAWDEGLVNLSHDSGHYAITLVVALCRLFVFLTRKVLWVLMYAGHAISSLMLRQMEFDADRYEAAVAGADSFCQTAERLRLLDVGSHAAFADLESAWRERRLADDLPKLIRSRESDLPPELRRRIAAHAASDKTGWLDTHPCDAARVAAVRRRNAPGVFPALPPDSEPPASVLFNDFDDLCRAATMDFYREMLDRGLHPENLVTTDAMVESRGEKAQSYQALRRFFQDVVHPLRPVFPGAVHVPTPPDRDRAAETMLAERTSLLDLAPRAAEAAKQFEAADDRLVAVTRARALHRAGVRRLDPELLALLGDPAAASNLDLVEQRAQAQRESARTILDAAAAAGIVRLQLALDLDKVPPTAASAAAAAAAASASVAAPWSPAPLPDPAPEEDYGAYDLAPAVQPGSGDTLLDALRALREAAPGLERLRHQFYALATLLSLLKPDDNSDELVAETLSASRRAADQLADTHLSLRRAAYPYDHAERGASIARYTLEHLPDAQEVGSVYQAAEATLDACYGLYMRLMSDLARRAERVEADLGLPPLPEPPEPPEPQDTADRPGETPTH